MQAADAEFVDLIGAIYDAVIDKTLWRVALERLCDRFDFEMAILAAQAFPRGNAVVHTAVNTPADYAARMPGYNEDVLAMWGGAARMLTFPLEEPYLNSAVTPRVLWEGNRFFREWARPLGIVDQVGMLLAHDRTVFGTLGMSIHGRRRPVSEADMQGLRLLGPHLRRAVVISRMLDIAVDTATTFRSALEATAAGVILVDPALRIIHTNAAAAAMLAAGDPVRSRGGRLSLREELLPGQLQRAVEDAGRNEAGLGRRGMAIPARRLDRSVAAVSVLPLGRRQVRGDLDAAATAAVFIADPAEPAGIPADAMRLLYDLTPAEQRVFALVVGGHGTTDIAGLLEIGIATVRTHLLHVFEKTGRRTRADLVRLERELAPPA